MTAPSSRDSSRHVSVLTAFAGTLLLGASSGALGDQLVIMTGVQTNSATETGSGGGFPGMMSGPQLTVEDICQNWDLIGSQFNALLGGVQQSINEAGIGVPFQAIQYHPDMPSMDDIGDDVEKAREQLCNAPQPDVRPEFFTITYSSCRMTMETRVQGPNGPGQSTNALVINMPQGASTAEMLAADLVKQEAVLMEMTSRIDQANQVIGQGWSDQIQMTLVGPPSTINGYDTEKFSFEYNSGLGDPDMGEILTMNEGDVASGAIGPQQLGNLVAVESSGEAWIAPSAPGIDIVRSFYENLTSRFSPDAGGTSFMGGMINNLVGLLQYGVPVKIEQTTTSRVMGRVAARGDSSSTIANIRVRDLPSDWCSRPLTLPSNYEITDVNQQMSEAMSGASGGPAAAGGANPDMDAAMQQYQDALAGMTDEQRQMLESMGMGNMMSQYGGGAPGGSPAGAPGAGPAGSSGAASGATSSADLMGSSVDESVSNHLQALGYDTGSGGSSDLYTAIAISQFQAERGMAVTGEASPQLLGILSSEVDQQR